MTTEATTAQKEKVLCLNRSDIFKDRYFCGFIDYNSFFLPPVSFEFVIRSKELEENPEIKQIIPYLIVVHKNKILTYARSKASGENRLHDKLSIGFGGHINEKDCDRRVPFISPTIISACEREATEEIGIRIPNLSTRLIPFGYINDDSNPVGQVHFAVVFLVDITEEEIKSCKTFEDSIKDARLMEIDECFGHFQQFEEWSKHTLVALKFSNLRCLFSGVNCGPNFKHML